MAGSPLSHVSTRGRVVGWRKPSITSKCEREGGWMAGSPSISHFDAMEGGGARESPPSRRNARRRVGGWQEAPPSHVSTQRRVCGCVEGMGGMGRDTWQGRRQEFDAMARQILGRTSCRLSVDRSDLKAYRCTFALSGSCPPQ